MITHNIKIDGTTIRESFTVPRGTVVELNPSRFGLEVVHAGRQIGSSFYLHPSDMMIILNNGRTPLWSAYTAGERERRIHANRQ